MNSRFRTPHSYKIILYECGVLKHTSLLTNDVNVINDNVNLNGGGMSGSHSPTPAKLSHDRIGVNMLLLLLTVSVI